VLPGFVEPAGRRQIHRICSQRARGRQTTTSVFCSVQGDSRPETAQNLSGP
jgi:hypothetical protein